MICERYRTDPAALIAALSAPAMLRRYLDAQEAELPALADRQMTAFLRRMGRLAGEAMGDGLTLLARRDPAAADALLSDLFAVATWQRWDIPAERLADGEVAVDGLPRGLLGADTSGEGAALWVVDHATVALARLRQAGEADWREHHPRGGCSH